MLTTEAPYFSYIYKLLSSSAIQLIYDFFSTANPCKFRYYATNCKKFVEANWITKYKNSQSNYTFNFLNHSQFSSRFYIHVNTMWHHTFALLWLEECHGTHHFCPFLSFRMFGPSGILPCQCRRLAVSADMPPQHHAGTANYTVNNSIYSYILLCQ